MPVPINENAVDVVVQSFWLWAYPLLAVFAAGLAASWAGARVPDRDDDGDGRPDLAPLILRGILQAVVFGAVVMASVWLDRRIHGEPQYLGLLTKSCLLLLLLWIGFRATETATRVARQRLLLKGRTAAAAVLPLLQKVAKGTLLALAVLVYLDNLGVNVSALIAGLGVGGLAVALASQRTVENLFGGIMLILDQPVRVGDFFRYDGKLGTVEDIGLRSTQIRTQDRTVVSIPNAVFSQMALENFAPRDRIWMRVGLGLRYETSADQMRAIVASLKELLLAHPEVDPEPARVRFIGFGAYSLDVEVFAYIRTADFNEFLQVREELFLQMMSVVEKAGSGFAFPSQTLYLGRDGGVGLPQPQS